MAGVPKPFANFVSLFLCPMYVVLLASILSRTSQIQMVVAVIAVALGSLAIMIMLLPLCSRLASHDRDKKYSINTLMLLMAILAIYLAYIRQLSSSMDAADFTLGQYAFYTFLSLLFMYITTAVLVRFTDSLIALLLIFVRFWPNNSRHN